MGLEQITGSKLAGIVVCFAGAVTVGLQDSAGSDVQQQTILGDAVALLAAVGYGLYTTMLRYQVCVS
jgi:drug/metabolite transporter (DMT)-like permease